MDENQILLILLIVASLGLAYSNGMNDCANAIAVCIGSRVLSPKKAILMSAVFNMAGALVGALFGAKVAETVGKGIVDSEAIQLYTVLAGVVAAVIWVVGTTHFGFPISISHSLVAGLVGAAVAHSGSDVIVWHGLGRILAAVIIAPLLGFCGAFLLTVVLLWIVRRRSPDKVNAFFSKLQIVAAAFMSFSHGKSDGQMPIALIALGFFLYRGSTGHLEFDTWVIIVSALAISLGTAIGGWGVIKTVGSKITALRPVNGFASDTSAALVVLMASNVGIPTSSTHASSAAVVGTGATKRLSAVAWGVAGNILAAWVLTFPACAAGGWALSKLLGQIV